MKKALMLAGLVLCASFGNTAENKTDLSNEGKKRNEEAYEKMLEQTGWRNEKMSRDQKNTQQGMGTNARPSSPAKSS